MGEEATAVLACLERLLPDVHVRTLETLGEGDFCVAYLLNRTLVVRQPKHGEGGRALEREACLMPGIAKQLSLTVPLPRIISSPGTSLAVHELVPGTELTLERWRALPRSDRSVLAQDLGGFLKDLHTVDLARPRACGLDTVDFGARTSGLRATLEEAQGSALPRDVRTWVTEALERYDSGDLGWKGAPVLLHGDVSPGHVFFDDDTRRLTGVIDWGDAMIGDPARDFIFLYEDWDQEFLELALTGYGWRGEAELLARILVLYMADQLEWTLKAAAVGRVRDVSHGIDALAQAVNDFAVVGER